MLFLMMLFLICSLIFMFFSELSLYKALITLGRYFGFFNPFWEYEKLKNSSHRYYNLKKLLELLLVSLAGVFGFLLSLVSIPLDLEIFGIKLTHEMIWQIFYYLTIIYFIFFIVESIWFHFSIRTNGEKAGRFLANHIADLTNWHDIINAKEKYYMPSEKWYKYLKDKFQKEGANIIKDKRFLMQFIEWLYISGFYYQEKKQKNEDKDTIFLFNEIKNILDTESQILLINFIFTLSCIEKEKLQRSGEAVPPHQANVRNLLSGEKGLIKDIKIKKYLFNTFIQIPFTATVITEYGYGWIYYRPLAK